MMMILHHTIVKKKVLVLIMINDIKNEINRDNDKHVLVSLSHLVDTLHIYAGADVRIPNIKMNYNQ
jgi:hypothetical protein